MNIGIIGAGGIASTMAVTLAGMDGAAVKKEYGNRLVLHGGVNAALYPDKEKMLAEVREKLPIYADGGGYIFSSDHSIPSNTSLETFREITDMVKAYKF